jgi:hypothetical protein
VDLRGGIEGACSLARLRFVGVRDDELPLQDIYTATHVTLLVIPLIE